MSKPITQLVKLVVPAGKATPSPPVGPALGARGVKAMDFCKEFNAKTATYTPSTPIPTIITISPDRTFSFTTRTPPVSHLLKLCASISKGSSTPPPASSHATRRANPPPTTSSSSSAPAAPAPKVTAGGKAVKEAPGVGFVGRVSVKQVYEIARIKMGDEDLRVLGLERVARGIVGSARSAGLEVVA